MRCFPGVPSYEKCRIQVSPVPACGINEDLFACVYECRFSRVPSVKTQRKDILLEVAKELGVDVHITLPKMEFKKRICQSKYFNDEAAKCLLEGILEEKREIKVREIKKREEHEIRKSEKHRLAREFELEALRAQLRNKLNENELKAGNRIYNLANVCYLSENRTAEVEKGKEINVYKSSDCEVKVKAGVFEGSVRAVAMCAQRVINPDGIELGFLELIGDKGDDDDDC
ncbi:hypothetical protein TNCV_236361 [Trichonephila clavipes]|nr:hypothetical protein TNCV_236361 [Trichonephila clavipes]